MHSQNIRLDLNKILRYEYQFSHINSKIYKYKFQNEENFNRNLIEFTEFESKLCS